MEAVDADGQPVLLRRAHKRHHPSVYVGYRIAFSHLSKSDLLGVGGFGKVFRAKYFGQTVAVKEIHENVIGKLKKEELEDIEHECMLHYHLRHQNIVEMLCFNTDLDRG
jgi:serine/threonine protein kinase